ncbi:MAG: LiaF transmembrane domain-containing protein [Bacillota bacterium]
MEEKDKDRPEQPSDEKRSEEAGNAEPLPGGEETEETRPKADQAAPGPAEEAPESSPPAPPVKEPFHAPPVQPFQPPQARPYQSPHPGPHMPPRPSPHPGPHTPPQAAPQPAPAYPPAAPPRPERRRSFTGPVILIVIGLVILLNNLGLLGWTIWEILWRFWPVWLIAIGIDMMFGRRGRWGGLLALALVLTMLGGVFYYATSWATIPITTATWTEQEEITQPLSGAREARVEIDSKVSQLVIRGGTDADSLLQGAITPIPGEAIAQSFNVGGSTAHYKLSSQFNGATIPFASHPGDGRWNLRLNEQIPMALTIQTGVGRSEIDLSGLIVTDLRITSGVGETTLILPARSDLRARVSTGVGQTTIRIPAGTAARIRVQHGLGGVSVRGDFVREGNYYVTPDYHAATQRIDLEIDGGVGGIRIEAGR